jgi:acyl dehydratase
MGIAPYEVVAHNTATQSDNKIHDDEVARRFGFSGGLVPGVDVYAYLTHIPAREWGLDWLEHGTMTGAFHKPVYEGGRVTVTVNLSDDDQLGLLLHDEQGVLCATGSAERRPEQPVLDASCWAVAEPRIDPPPASPRSLEVGTALALGEHGFRADKAGAYLDEVRETLTLYREHGVAHPGWLLRDANYVLASNVRLGPWIHVSSVVQHHALVRDGQRVAARATVTREWEHKGHRFVALDVALTADDTVVARVDHTAIYRPRQAQ